MNYQQVHLVAVFVCSSPEGLVVAALRGRRLRNLRTQGLLARFKTCTLKNLTYSPIKKKETMLRTLSLLQHSNVNW